MAPRASISAPTTAALPHAHVLLSSSVLVGRTLAKLSRPSLLILVHEWLKSSNQTTCAPFLRPDDDDEDGSGEAPYLAAQSLEELRQIYEDLQSRKGAKREVLDRILEGDWRHGISLRQLAMADLRNLLEHPTAQRWTALQLKQITLSDEIDSDDEIHYTIREPPSSTLPRFHAPTFLQNLQNEISPFVKAHYYLTRATSMPLTLLRIYIHDSPYNSQRSLLGSKNKAAGDRSKVIYVAFPDGSPSIYVSLATISGISTAGDSRSLRNIVLDALPKAFSRPHHRYTLKSTSLSARSLSALLPLRGPGRSNAAAGGWSIFADGSIEESPLDSVLTESKPSHGHDDHTNGNKSQSTANLLRTQNQSQPGRPPHENASEHEATPNTKRRKLLATNRFGTSAVEGDGKGIERLEMYIEDPYPTVQPNPDSSPHQATDSNDEPEAPTTQNPKQQPSRSRSQRQRRTSTSLLDQSHLSSSSPPSNNQPSPPNPDPTQTDQNWKPAVRLTFHGTHVFAGIRHLVENGAVDGVRMPGWMTGEEGVSVGVVRDGRVRGCKGAGGL
ncbi:hypothetical protein MMC16_003860 [Acarospora aff. strigata]|nr:hypothetical protein [Acarospora aff. strigata]